MMSAHANSSALSPPHAGAYAHHGRVLVVDDDPESLEFMRATLAADGFSVQTATTATEALALVDTSLDAVLTDIHLGPSTGIALCNDIKARHRMIPVIMVSAFGEMDTIIAALRAGAADVVTKPCSGTELSVAVGRVTRDRHMHRKVMELSSRLSQQTDERVLIGESPSMAALDELLSQVAPTPVTVLITGETGTGKELVARAVHQRSERRGPFVAINCAAITATLLESELFGHVKGAFTDARTARQGLITQANGGTLFLDEIGEMALETQVKMLRVLQERTVRPVGSNQDVPFSARIVAATNRDLAVAVKQGEFREDLLYRINVVPLQVPPLRDRGDDILVLAQHFLRNAAARMGKSVGGLSDDAAARLIEYDWPGNVRELENTIERAVAFTRYRELTTEDLPKRIRSTDVSDILLPWSSHENELLSLAEIEARYVRSVVAAVDNDYSYAAASLGIDRRTMLRYLDPPDEEAKREAS